MLCRGNLTLAYKLPRLTLQIIHSGEAIMFKLRSRASFLSPFISRLNNFFFSKRSLNIKRVFKWTILSTFVFIFMEPWPGFAQDTSSTSSKSSKSSKNENPIESYWIQNLFFTRGLKLDNTLLNLEGNGAFAARWKFIYSHPIGSRFQVEFGVPFDLAVPSEGKSVAGLGDINTQFQFKVKQRFLLDVQQLLGLNLFLPTGSHTQTGGDLMTLNPKYQISFLAHHYIYIVPNFSIDYFHSVIELDDAKNLRALNLSPSISLPHIFPENIGLNGTITLDWYYNFVSDRNGGTLTADIAKTLTPLSVIDFAFGSGISSNNNQLQKYEVSILAKF